RRGWGGQADGAGRGRADRRSGSLACDPAEGGHPSGADARLGRARRADLRLRADQAGPGGCVLGSGLGARRTQARRMSPPLWLIAGREFRAYTATASFWVALAIGPLAMSGVLGL